MEKNEKNMTFQKRTMRTNDYVKEHFFMRKKVKTYKGDDWVRKSAPIIELMFGDIEDDDLDNSINIDSLYGGCAPSQGGSQPIGDKTGTGKKKFSLLELLHEHMLKYWSTTEEVTSDLVARVQEWEETMMPILEEEETRKEFDIHEYGDELLSMFKEVGETKTLDELLIGRKKYEVSRYFLACLMMANTYNVRVDHEIRKENGVETPIMMITLLKKDRHHEACDLAELVKSDDFPHLLVHGPSGAGKRTRIHCILRELYGAGAERLHLDKKSLVTPSNRKIEIDTVSSNYHIEINPGEVGIYDRVVVQDVVKQMAQTSQISSATQKSFKVVVLMEADQLTRDAQHALRRTMEKYSMTCRLILCCESLSRIIGPLKSRCMIVRVGAPSDEEIRDVCTSVAERVRLTVPDPVMDQIVAKSRGNLRRALLSMEAVKRKGVPIKETEQVPEPEWEIYLRETAELMIKKQNNENILAVRERLYELISRCIQPNLIFL
ncbi:hypothetical protein OSTOST_16134, partial [Ostertagia ostertagi]